MDPGEIIRQAENIQEHGRFLANISLTFVGIIIASNAAVAALLLQGLRSKAWFLPLGFICFDLLLAYESYFQLHQEFIDLKEAWQQLGLKGWTFPFDAWTTRSIWIALAYLVMVAGWIFYWVRPEQRANLSQELSKGMPGQSRPTPP